MPLNPIASLFSISIILRPLLGFALGVVAAYLLTTGRQMALILLLSSIVSYIALHLLPADIKRRWAQPVSLILLLIGFMAIGMLRYTIDAPSSRPVSTPSAAAIYSLRIEEHTKIGGRYDHYKGAITAQYSDSTGWRPLSIQTQITTTSAHHYPSGTQLWVYGRVEPLRALSNPDRFDYHQWLIEQGYQATLWVDSSRCSIVGINHSPSLILKTRERLLQQIDHHIDNPDSRSILKAIALGHKLELDRTTKALFSASGAMHLLVVSGLHTGIIFMIVQFLLFFLGNRPLERIFRFVTLISLLWLYVALTGGANPVVRAAIMLTISELSRLLNYRSLSFNNLFIAAFIILMIHPGDLFAVGFQLSFGAVLSILCFSRYQKWWIPTTSHKPLRFIYNLIYMSITVQIGVAPLVAFYFQSFPLWFLPTNLIAIPLVTILLPLYILAVVATPIPIVAHGLFELLNLIVTILIQAISILTDMPLSGSWAPSVSPIELGLFYLLVILIVRWAVHPFYSRTISLLASIVTVLIYSSYSLYINNNNNHSAYISNDLRNSRVVVSSREPGAGVDSGYIAYNHHSIYLMKGRGWYRRSTPEPLTVDYLVIDRHIYPSVDYLKSLFNYRILVLDGSIRGDRLAKWEGEIAASQQPTTYYSLYKTGGLVIQ